MSVCKLLNDTADSMFCFFVDLWRPEFENHCFLRDYLILFFVFYPPAFAQAQARCHRIGQNKAVKVYRLITRNSYEREMFDRASLKLGLDKAVLQSMSGRDNSLGGVGAGGAGGTGGGVSHENFIFMVCFE